MKTSAMATPDASKASDPAHCRKLHCAPWSSVLYDQRQRSHRMTGSSMPACTACASARSSALSDRRRLTWGRITYHLRRDQD